MPIATHNACDYRTVLRFYLSWDDTKSLYGEQQNYILHYFLADKTVEVREKHEPNSGKVCQ